MASPDVEVSPSDLRFRFQLNKQLLATIAINNPSKQRVAFKIKTTAPKKYVVRPSSGVVEPRSNVSIQVIMQAQKEYAPEFANCKDKFMVQTTALGEAESIEKDTFNKDVRQDLKEYRLRVTIEGPAAPPSPVAEDNEDNDESGRAHAHTAPSTTPPALSASEQAPQDTRLRSAMDDASLTSQLKQLQSQVTQLQRERDDLRRQLDSFHLSRPPSTATPTAKAAAGGSSLSIVLILLAAILAFLLGHYARF